MCARKCVCACRGKGSTLNVPPLLLSILFSEVKFPKILFTFLIELQAHEFGKAE